MTEVTGSVHGLAGIPRKVKRIIPYTLEMGEFLLF
jgi:hypothetical protein